MAYTKKTITALIDLGQTAAAKKFVLDAFKKAGCSRTDAAKVLGCDRQTFGAWVAKLDLEKTLAALKKTAKKQGWHHTKIGRRKGSKNKPKQPATETIG